MGFIYSQLFVTPKSPTQSFAGKTVIVTGSNTGLGKEASRHIAKLGAERLILAVRNTEAGETAKKEIVASTGNQNVEVWKLDLSSYDSVKAFANKASTELDRVDVLLENAGIATDKRALAEGHERTITVNVISTFLLAFLMLPKLKETAKKFNTKPHLTIVSSEVHAWTKFPEKKAQNIFETLSAEKNSASMMKERYMTSKLLEVLVIRQIAPSLQNSDVILNYINPGLCHSELGRDSGIALKVLKAFLARTTEEGSRTLVAGAVGGPESHGKYMTDCHVADDALSPFVRSPEGDAAGKQVWSELKVILENVQTGVTSGL